MWLSKQRRNETRVDKAGLGTVTLQGAPAGVYLDGERREVPIFGPGGYHWKPATGQQVLVLKTGGEGETPCIAGVQTAAGALAPGEVAVSAETGGAAVRLRLNGTVELVGDILVNGVPIKEYCAPPPPVSGGTA